MILHFESICSFDLFGINEISICESGRYDRQGKTILLNFCVQRPGICYMQWSGVDFEIMPWYVVQGVKAKAVWFLCLIEVVTPKGTELALDICRDDD